MRLSALAVVVCVAAACRANQPRTIDPVDSTGGTGDGTVRKVAHVIGLEDPESVRYDPDLDVYFVSNILGYGSAKDGVGYIARVNAGDVDKIDIFVDGGKNGATLNAPKGMAIVGDTLWVADIDVLRGFNRRTGAPVAVIDFAKFSPTLLNDVAAAPDGSVRVTDTGILMTDKGVIYKGGDRIFAMDAHRNVTVVAQGAELGYPNGITWDAANKRWLMVNFARFASALTASPGPDGGAQRTVLSSGIGREDGVEVLPDGRIAYTCWNDSSVHVYANGKDRQLIRNLPTPADIGVDTRRGRIAVPLSAAGRVEIWSLR